MFGVLRGTKCVIGSERWDRWIGHVCGVCATLNENYGQASRLAMNYDAAFLSVLCEAQDPNPQHQRTNRCLLRRASKIRVTSPNNPGAQFAASMSLVAASTRIEDQVQDGDTFLKHLPGMSIKVARKWKEAAQGTARALGFDSSFIEAQARRQGSVEARPNQDFSFYARPTELSVGAAFGHTAVLVNRPQNAGILVDIGRMFGRIVYLLDSYRDGAMDLSLGKFNALAASYAGEAADQQAGTIFHEAFQRIKQRFNQLDLPQPSLARDLLIHQLPRVGHKTLNLSECAVLRSPLPVRARPISMDGAGFSWKARDAGSQDGTRSKQPSSLSKIPTSDSGGEVPRRRCPHCGWFVDEDSATCIHCGREIEPAAATRTEQDPAEKRLDSCCQSFDRLGNCECCDDCLGKSGCESCFCDCCVQGCCEILCHCL